jgi:hypothetical protein
MDISNGFGFITIYNESDNSEFIININRIRYIKKREDETAFIMLIEDTFFKTRNSFDDLCYHLSAIKINRVPTPPEQDGQVSLSGDVEGGELYINE